MNSAWQILSIFTLMSRAFVGWIGRCFYWTGVTSGQVSIWCSTMVGSSLGIYEYDHAKTS
nr:hypothetical protein Q903MT_gene2279 [Picea sitchensis]